MLPKNLFAVSHPWEACPQLVFDWSIKLPAADGWAGRQRPDFKIQRQGDQRKGSATMLEKHKDQAWEVQDRETASIWTLHSLMLRKHLR